MNKTKLTRFLKNPEYRSYNQSTVRVKALMRIKFKDFWGRDIFKGINNEEGD